MNEVMIMLSLVMLMGGVFSYLDYRLELEVKAREEELITREDDCEEE